MKTFRYLIAGLLLLAALPSQSKEEEISVSRSWGKLSGTLTVPDEGSDAAVLIIAGSGPTDRNGNSGSGLITNTYYMLARALEKEGIASLRYDKPAIFEAGTTFDEYIAGQVKWDDDEPAARIILRYTVTPEGKAVLAQELESTDNRLKRRVLKALSEAPHWHPAQKNGVAVASEGVLHIQLPKGKRMPRPVELVWR